MVRVCDGLRLLGRELHFHAPPHEKRLHVLLRNKSRQPYEDNEGDGGEVTRAIKAMNAVSAMKTIKVIKAMKVIDRKYWTMEHSESKLIVLLRVEHNTPITGRGGAQQPALC